MATVTILVSANGRDIPVEMPGATTGMYAAKRGAEAWGLNPDVVEYFLVDPVSCRRVEQDEVIADWDGQALLLGIG